MSLTILKAPMIAATDVYNDMCYFNANEVRKIFKGASVFPNAADVTWILLGAGDYVHVDDSPQDAARVVAEAITEG